MIWWITLNSLKIWQLEEANLFERWSIQFEFHRDDRQWKIPMLIETKGLPTSTNFRNFQLSLRRHEDVQTPTTLLLFKIKRCLPHNHFQDSVHFNHTTASKFTEPPGWEEPKSNQTRGGENAEGKGEYSHLPGIELMRSVKTGRGAKLAELLDLPNNLTKHRRLIHPLLPPPPSRSPRSLSRRPGFCRSSFSTISKSHAHLLLPTSHGLPTSPSISP